MGPIQKLNYRAVRRPRNFAVQRGSNPMTQGSYRQFCPVAMSAEILCTRWTVVLLREFIAGSTRFNDLRRGVPRMSPALLSQRLKELEATGIIARVPVSGEPGILEYRLTVAGRELRPLIEAFGVWG
jgi:DNA-binding HxlR family transcriptional regulator